MLRWLFVLLLLVTASLLHAEVINDPALLELLRTSPTEQDYPDADAVCLLREMTLVIEPSGAFTVRERKIIKILTMQGLRMAQWQIPYDTAGEQLRIITARTLLNGQAVPVDLTQVVENAVFPGYAWYDSMVVRRFPLPAARIGAALEVASEIHHSIPRVPNAFSTRLSLRQPYPVCETRYRLELPAEQRLAVRFLREEQPPAIDERVENGTRVYSWTMRNLPAWKITEVQTPPAADLTPSVRITSLTSWQPVVAWYQAITEGKAAVTEELRRVAQERTAGCVTMEEKIAALHKAVREIPYVAVEMGALSDTPHSADEVARRNYGDCKDKATLLRALLQAVDIPSDYVLIRTTDRGKLDREQYGPDEFNHVILVARTPSGPCFLDATIADAPAHQLPPLVDGAEGLIIRGQGELVTLPASTAVDNRTVTTVTVAVKDDGSASGQVSLIFHGINAMMQRGVLAGVARDRYREALEGYLSSRLGPEVVIDSVSIDKLREPEYPLTITAEFSSPSYVQPAGEQFSGFFPAFAYQPNPYRSVSERKYPFYQSIDSSLRLDVTITLPKTFVAGHLPTPLRYTTALGEYRDSITAQGQTLTYTCDLINRRGVFPPDTLNEIRRWSAVLALEGRNQLQFFLRHP